MTVWADDEEGKVQVEVGIDSDCCWSSFDK
jgi:hypothetical protein